MTYPPPYPPQPGAWVPAPGAASPKRSGLLKSLIAVSAALAVALIVGAYFLGHSQGVSYERSRIDKATYGSDKALSHTAAEDYIDNQYNLTGEVCNDGTNMPVVPGSSYQCTDDDGHDFTLTIQSARGDYQVQPH